MQKPQTVSLQDVKHYNTASCAPTYPQLSEIWKAEGPRPLTFHEKQKKRFGFYFWFCPFTKGLLPLQ